MVNNVINQASLDKAANKLLKLSRRLGIVYFSASQSREIFFREINYFISAISREVSINCLSVRGGLDRIEQEIRLLEKQESQMALARIVQYAAIKKENVNRRVNLILNQVGFIGGGVQFFGGGGVCAVSSGMLCAAYGMPLMMHGLNNIYENGYYLLYRKQTSGLTRDTYRLLAHRLGASGQHADTAYSVVDIGLSGYGMTRQVPLPDKFRLFRHINTDFIRGWQDMGAVPLSLEITGDINNLSSIYKLGKEESNVQ